jgi:cell division cycle protein 37
MLKEAIAKMPEDEAKYHMKRCVDSGLWVPEAGASKDGMAEKEPEQSDKVDALDLD